MIYKKNSNKTKLGFDKRSSSYQIKWRFSFEGGGIIYMPYIPHIVSKATDKIEMTITTMSSPIKALKHWLKK